MSWQDPISFETLVAYWLGEVPPAPEATLEEHLFSCAHCTRRLEELAALAGGVRAVVEDGKVSVAVSRQFLESMKQAGLRLREYRLDPGGSVNCTIRADEDAVISRLQASLEGVARVDLVRVVGEGAPEMRVTDVPFDAKAGEVLIVPSAAWLKTMPAFTMRMRLIAVDGSAERPIGDYTFHHSPS